MEKFIDSFKGFLFWLILFLLYYLFLPNFMAVFLVDYLKSNNFWSVNLAYLAIYLSTFLIIIFLVRKDLWKQFKSFLKAPKKILNKGFNYWIYGILVMFLSNLIITSLVGGIAVNEQATRDSLFSTPFYAIPTIIFMGPFLEEVIFRFAFRKMFHKEYIYALCSAFVFGLLHVSTALDSFTISNIIAHAGEFLFIIPYGSLGFFFAKAYYETENIFSSIVPHILHNTLSVLLIFLTSFLG